MKYWLTGLSIALTFAYSTLSLAQESWQGRSSDKQLAVLEIFTAEGCGNCPAADRWIQSLPELGMTDNEVIVLGFHVDYLNETKGWVDQFADPIFSERQKQLALINLYQTVYTPEIFVSGEVVHNWREHGTEIIRFVNSFEPEAGIELTINKQDQLLAIHSDVQVAGEENRQHAKMYLAVVEDNLRSEIGGGDNAGATFNHQNVVRQWLGPFDLDSDGTTEIQTQLNLDKNWKQQDLRVVALVQNLYDGYVLQGLAIPLTE